MTTPIYPTWLKQPYTQTAHDLAATLGRIGARVQGAIDLAEEKNAALAWCRANGNPHKPVIWPQYGLHGEN